VVIKSLSMLHPPLLTPLARSELLRAAIEDYGSNDVRLSIMRDVLHRLHPSRGRLFQVRAVLLAKQAKA
jgi:hypothetical protein